MKKILTVTLLFLFTLSVFSQDNSGKREYYLHKSKNQKTAFWVLAGTGTALLITGMAYGSAHNDPNKDNYNYTGGFLGAGGLVLAAVSVPFIFGSSRNKTRAMTFSVKSEMIKGPEKNSYVFKRIPAFQLLVGL